MIDSARNGRNRRGWHFLWSAWLMGSAGAAVVPARAAEPIRWDGKPAELTIHAISERTFQIVLAPLDDGGKPKLLPPSTALVEQKAQLKLRSRELSAEQIISAGKTRLTIRPQPLTVTVQRANGKAVQELSFDETKGLLTFHTDAPVLGMGEGAQQFDRRGAWYSMKDGWGAWNLPIYGSWVAVPFLIGTDGWALFVNQPRGQFDLRKQRASFQPAAEVRGQPLDVYVMAWDQPADVLEEYIHLTGRPVMPPKWALGYMQSHRTLRGPDEVLEEAKTFRAKKLPCDALIYLGTGYCPAGWNLGHGSADFNPRTFDKPAAIIDQLHADHFHVVLHQNHAPRNLSGLAVGAATEADKPGSISKYWEHHRKTFALGIDGWWPDDGDELPREARLARHRMYYEGPLRDRPNVRPWSLHRTGFAGVQRYGGWMWSGDIDSRWRTLAEQVAVGQNHSLSLTPFWGTDIGGFVPKKELAGELYARWFQFGTFCASFRAHGRTWHLRLPWGWNLGEFGPIESRDHPDASELHNEAVEPICRKFLDLRYQLLPYNYSLCREAHDTGLPLMRALWLHYPDDSKAVTRSDEYLWGRDLLVAPVTTQGAKERGVYLPQGAWYDFWTGERHTGGREIVRAVDLATLPLFVRAGAIVPLDPKRQYVAEPTMEATIIRIYPGRNGTFRWYQDDGASLDYLQGKCAWIRLSWDDAARKLTIEPEAGKGAYPLEPRKLVVEMVPGGERKPVQFTGQRVEVAF